MARLAQQRPRERFDYGDSGPDDGEDSDGPQGLGGEQPPRAGALPPGAEDDWLQGRPIADIALSEVAAARTGTFAEEFPTAEWPWAPPSAEAFRWR
eukprot:12661895-Alexandrium_andersonii.AAC.1